MARSQRPPNDHDDQRESAIRWHEPLVHGSPENIRPAAAVVVVNWLTRHNTLNQLKALLMVTTELGGTVSR